MGKLMQDEQRKISGAMSDALCRNDSEEFQRLYLANLQIGQGDNWLYRAARNGIHEAIPFLIEQGHSPNENSGTSVSSSALVAACGEGSAECVRLLLQAGASIDIESLHNPLIGAITGRSLECAKLLVEAGIDIHRIYTLEDGRRRNALEYAERRGCRDIAEYLESLGAVHPSEEASSSGSVSASEKIVATLQTWFRGKPPKSAGSIGLGKDYGEAELLWFDMSTMDYPFLTTFTVGLSTHLIETPTFGEGKSRIELMMHVPFTWPMDGGCAEHAEFQWPLNWMRTLPQHILSGSIPLPGTHLIISNDEPPEPLGAGTEQSCLLLIADFYQCFPVKLIESEKIHFFHVIPLYTEERDFEKANGMEPLLLAMAEKGPESLVVRPDRERFVV